MQLVGVEARESEKHNPFLIAGAESRNNILLNPFLLPLSLWLTLTHGPVCHQRRRQQVSSVQRLFHSWAMLGFSGRSGSCIATHSLCLGVVPTPGSSHTPTLWVMLVDGVLVIQSLPEDETILLLSCCGYAGHTLLEWSERTLGMHLSPTHELLPWTLLGEVGWAAALDWMKISLSTSWV